MRIRWTTRIAMGVGVLTMVAAIAAGGGSASAAQAGGTHAAGTHAAGYVTGAAGAARP
jgi:hypothetical protein